MKLRPAERQKVAALVAHFGTQTATAEQLGVHPTNLGKWLGGKTGWWPESAKKVKSTYKDVFNTIVAPLPKVKPEQLEFDLPEIEPEPVTEPTDADFIIEVALGDPTQFELMIVDRRITGVMFK